MNFLTVIASKVLGMSQLMIGIVTDDLTASLEESGYGFLVPILTLIDSALVPLMIIILAAGTIYSVILGVNMARADSTEKREEAKKRLINAIVGFGIIIVLLAVIYALAGNIDSILGLAGQSIETK